MQTEEVNYPSSAKRVTIHVLLWLPTQTPRAVVQLSHGMAEHIGRYAAFAEYLVAAGIAVAGNDHMGHGASVNDTSEWGYFYDADGDKNLVEDMRRLCMLLKKRFPKVPLFLLGHSMGSFLVRRFAMSCKEELSGVILSGTGCQPQVLLSAGMLLIRIMAVFRGWTYRSALVDGMAMGGMNKEFEPSGTGKDWLCRDDAVVRAYADDKRCGFVFTLNGYYHLFRTIACIQKQGNIRRTPEDLPVLLVSGSEDPVGAKGRGVEKVAGWYRRCGMKRVKVILYEGMRHEILNETEKEKVYADILGWLQSICGQ